MNVFPGRWFTTFGLMMFIAFIVGGWVLTRQYRRYGLSEDLASSVVMAGAIGGIVGALVDLGVPEHEAHVYSEAVRRGGTMLSVRTDDTRVATVRAILDRFLHHATTIAITGRSYRMKDAPVLTTHPNKAKKTHEPSTAGGAS